MHTDKMLNTEAPNPITKAPILGQLVAKPRPSSSSDGGAGAGTGTSSKQTSHHEASRISGDAPVQQQGGDGMETTNDNNSVQAPNLDLDNDSGFEQGGADNVAVGQEGIIPPLPIRATPHRGHPQQHQHQGEEEEQAPAHPPTLIKSAPLSVSREASGGDRESTFAFSFQISSTSPKMIFSDLYKSPRLPFSKLRSAHPHGVAVPSDLDADLISKDKAKQKEAVRRFLTEKIRTDWDFSWPSVTDSPPTPLNKKEDEHSSPAPTANDPTTSAPDVVPSTVDAVGGLGVIPVTVTVPAPPLTAADEEGIPRDPGEEADSESDAESVYSTISEDAAHYRARAEWTSDLSDDEAPRQDASPFRFDNPDSVGTTVQSLIITRQALRRRAVREEVAWNKGLACFEARRNAWTGAKTVRVKPKQPVPVPPASPRRLFRRHHRTESLPSPAFSAGSPPAASSPLSPISTHNSQQLDGMAITPPPSESDSAHSGSLSKSTTASGVHRTSSQESSPHILYPVETLIPIPPPLLPAQNPMRASVTPNIYPSLYDKIVVHSLQPSCPVNLGDMLRACVVGWKRDGEWPPRAPVQPMPTASEMAAMRRRKAQQQYQQQKQHVRKDSSATVGSSRRLSFGIFGGGSKTEKVNEEKESKENNSDETAGKGIRRSLLRVFSHGHSSQSTSGAVLSPTSPTTVASPTLPINEVVTPILA